MTSFQTDQLPLEITIDFKENIFNIGVFSDLSLAFNTVNHKIGIALCQWQKSIMVCK